MKEYIFSYGTLQNPVIQNAVLGRKLASGSPDTVRGYQIKLLKGIHNPFNIAVPKEGASIQGVVYEITSDDLPALDEYEGDAYIRVSVTLVSNTRAWMYRDNPNSRYQKMIVDVE